MTEPMRGLDFPMEHEETAFGATYSPLTQSAARRDLRDHGHLAAHEYVSENTD